MRTALYLLLFLLPATMLAQQNDPSASALSNFQSLTKLSPEQPPVQQNDPQLTAKMNAQMTAQRPAAVFEENKGQMKDQHWQLRPDVLFNGSASGMAYYVRDNGMSYQLSRVESWKDEEDDRLGMPGREKRQVPDEMGTYRVDVQWTDFNTDYTVEKGTELPGYTNYYNVPEGVEPALFVKQYESVTLRGLYEGIDLHLYGTDGHLETDWLVAPGADYTQISFEVKGAALSVDAEGHLIMGTPFGEIREGTLKVFQEGRQLEARWVISPLEGDVPGGVVSFEVMGHNPMLAMRIDPLVRLWGTYYGGSGSGAGGADYGQSCATDGSGNVYLAGTTGSPNAIASGGHQNTIGGGYTDAFLVKFNAGGVRQWGTYYGGDGWEEGNSCATDGSGNMYLAGNTLSSNAIASGGHQNSIGGGGADAFLVKFDNSGLRQWATYYGGANPDQGEHCSTDGLGNVYLVGRTRSTDNIAAGGHQDVHSNSGDFGIDYDAFLVKFNSDGARQWGTYYGGTYWDIGHTCSLDTEGNVYLSGQTRSANNIAFAGHQNTGPTAGDTVDFSFLVKFDAQGVRQWGTYFGGTCGWSGPGYCATDVNGNIYLSGTTWCANSVSYNGHQNSLFGDFDAFLAKFSTDGVRLWATYYGGGHLDSGLACATDSNGNVYLTGNTQSSDNIAFNGFQNADSLDTEGLVNSAFLVAFNSDGIRQWGSYYGGNGHESGRSCAIDVDGNIYLAGETGSFNVIASGGHQNTYGGGTDAFLVKFNGMTNGLGNGVHTDLSFTVFPNPGNGHFSLVTSEGGAVRLKVTDISGREVHSESYTATPGKAHDIDIRNQANGVYTLRIETGKGTGGVRLVKE